MSSTVGYFGLAFRAKAMPYYENEDPDEEEKFWDLLDEWREFTEKKFSLSYGQDFFVLEMKLGDDWDSGYYGLWSFRKMEQQLGEKLPIFVEWMFDRGHEIRIYGEVKFFLEIYYNGSDSHAAMSSWEDI